jgi:hypothetical protein
VPTRVWTLRLTALIGAGAFGVHQLRYTFSYGHEAGGHGYLIPVGPALAATLLLVLAVALGRVARGAHDPAPSIGRVWAGASAALFVLYCAQESVEGAFSGRVPGMFEHGGWVALPLAVGVGLAVALIMRGAAEATRLTLHGAPARSPITAAPLRIVLPPWTPPSTRATARHLAARGPPVVA